MKKTHLVKNKTALHGAHSDDGFRSGCRNVSQHQQQSFSGLHYKPGRSLKPQHGAPTSAQMLKKRRIESQNKFPVEQFMAKRFCLNNVIGIFKILNVHLPWTPLPSPPPPHSVRS